jgi:hypothetical protein
LQEKLSLSINFLFKILQIGKNLAKRWRCAEDHVCHRTIIGFYRCQYNACWDKAQTAGNRKLIARLSTWIKSLLERHDIRQQVQIRQSILFDWRFCHPSSGFRKQGRTLGSWQAGDTIHQACSSSS